MAAYSACKKGTLITGSRQDFRFFLLDLCLGTAPQNMGTAPQSMGTAPKKLEATPLSRPLVPLHLRGSRPGDPRFLLLVLFSTYIYTPEYHQSVCLPSILLLLILAPEYDVRTAINTLTSII